MKRARLLIAFGLLVAVVFDVAGRQTSAPSNGRLTIEKLIDIKHPSSPLWSHDSKRIAFLWDRAGVTDLYIVPADASSKPMAVTTGGGVSAGFFWSGDSKSLYFNRNGQAMQVSADGG